MFSSFERMVASRYLRAKRKDGFVSLTALFSFLGIVLGVATLIVVMAVMNGFRIELMDRILGINAHITVSGYRDGINNYEELSQTLLKIEGVSKSSPVILGQVLATANKKHAGAMVRGMTLADLKNKTLVADNITFGNIEDFSDNNSVIIGGMMAQSMGLVPDDIIRLISPESTTTFFGNMPRLKDFRVAGIFNVGMFEYDSTAIFMPLEMAQIYFKKDNVVSSIEIYVDNPEEIAEIVKKINIATDNQYHLIDWQEANAKFFSSLKVERVVMAAILALILVVAAFNIISGMVMLVTGKKQEIAILRTIGATRGNIMRIFFICGASIGFIGTFFGFLLGYGIASNIESIRQWLEAMIEEEIFPPEVYYLTKLPAHIELDNILFTVGFSLIISFLATLYPAWRAARISPSEGVRL